MDVPESIFWFGPYRLSARVATGGMAEVYLGRRRMGESRLGPAVAVKRLLPHLIKDSAVVRMFLNEARITAQIDHPNVVRILELGQEGREPFIAMELLEGRSLADLRQAAAEAGQRLPLNVMLRVLSEACQGLDAAHRAVDENGNELSIVHRDFSPDNIHVGVDGQVKVIDFGIATAANMTSGTEPGTLKGKFFYMSPEMIAGAPVDHRADMFAAGVMLYEQLCGRRPFTGLTTDEVLARIAEGKPKRPSLFDPSVPPVLEAICLTALSNDPRGRFPSLREFIDALESVGTITPLASQLQVADCMSTLFPEEDPKRQALQRARQRDPSLPSIPPETTLAPELHDAPETTGEAPLPEPELEEDDSDPDGLDEHAEESSGEPDDEPEPPPRAPAKARGKAKGKTAPARVKATAKPPRRGRWLFALLFVLLATGGYLYWRQPWQRTLRLTGSEPLRKSILTKLEAKDLDHALADARRYSDEFPDDAQGPLLEAQAYIALRQGKHADASLDRAEQLGPSDPAPDLLRAQLREMQGDVGGALDSLGAALKKKPADRNVQRERALLLSRANRLDEAVPALNAVLARHFDAEVAAELGFVKLRQAKKPEDAREAVTILRHALKKKPRMPAAQYYLGSALAMQGDTAGAERAYRDAMELAPTDPRPLSGLCQLQAKGGHAADAEATRALLKSKFPEQAAALLADCHPDAVAP